MPAPERNYSEARIASQNNAGSIADAIALEHAAGDEAHVTGLSLEYCQWYVRRNAALAAELAGDGE